MFCSPLRAGQASQSHVFNDFRFDRVTFDFWNERRTDGSWILRVGKEVEIYSIRVTWDENIRRDQGNHRPNRRNNLDDVELVRYEKRLGDVDFRVTTENAGSGFQYDTTIGYILPNNSRESGTRPLYECKLANRDYFLSIHRSCEGQERIGQVGRIFESQVNGSIPLYRCYDGFDHAASTFGDCEGLGNNEGVLGYIL